jgi:hypothetical protein
MRQLLLDPPAAEERVPRFDTPNVLWFFGAIATASASNALVTAVHPSARGVWILLVALGFAALYAGLSAALRASRWWVPGGLFAAIVVAMVPAVGVGFERLIGVWPSEFGGDSVFPNTFEGAFFALGLATMAVGLVVYGLVRFDFVLAPVVLAALVSAQLFLPAVADRPSSDGRSTTFIVTGGVLVLVGLLLDSRGRRRAAFWWHVLGLGGVAVGLVYFANSEGSGGAWAAMLVTGTVVLLLAAPLGRATWAVYGVAGAYAPLVHYIAEGGGRWQIPLILVIVSLGVLFLGIVVHVYGAAWGTKLRVRYRF